MFHALDVSQYDRVRPLCADLDAHLAPHAIVAGAALGRVYVDDPARPAAALVCNAHRYYLCGSPDEEAFLDGLRRHLLEDIYPMAQAVGEPTSFALHYGAGWEEAVRRVMAGKDPLPARRRYLECDAPAHPGPVPLPEGYCLRAVDARLLAEERLANRDALQEEMCSERDSVEEFLARSFGVSATCGEELAAWCLSEYNLADRCEVGIETTRPHRRRGLATALATALVAEAAARGIRRVGWHAEVRNAPSIATALRAGFADGGEYPVYYAWFDEASNLGAHGNTSLWAGGYAEAAGWFDRALRGDRPPYWVWWGAACAYARVGQEDEALAALRHAVVGGHLGAQALRTSPHLAALQGTPGWRDLLAGLEPEAPSAGA